MLNDYYVCFGVSIDDASFQLWMPTGKIMIDCSVIWFFMSRREATDNYSGKNLSVNDWINTRLSITDTAADWIVLFAAWLEAGGEAGSWSRPIDSKLIDKNGQ